MIVLMGIVLLAGMIFYVVNVGDQLNGHLSMQNAADSAAISGATWMARSMNVVAMNNVAQTRMLALVPVLDSLPLATNMAYTETMAWTNRLNEQITVIEATPSLKTIHAQDSPLYTGLNALRDRFNRECGILAPMDRFFNGSTFRMENLTYWQLQDQSGPPPHGSLWRAAVALDEFSQSVSASSGVLSQANAASYGQVGETGDAFVVPILPQFPGRQGAFADFEKPVKSGIIPDRVWPYRLGPFDRLFQWRDYQYQTQSVPDQWVPGSIRPGSSGLSLSGRTRGQGAMAHNPNGFWSQRVISRTVLGYDVYGPFDWMMRRINDYALFGNGNSPFAAGALADTYFTDYINALARAKRDYMWGPKVLKPIHKPQWVTDFKQAQVLAIRPDVKVYQTLFYDVEVRSRYPKEDPQYLSPGSYFVAPVPRAIWTNGWIDPTDPKNRFPAQIGQWVWEDEYFYETNEDASIGLTQQTDAAGQPIWQRVYIVADYVFGGIDVGGNINIADPSNYGSVETKGLPSPILVDTNRGDYPWDEPPTYQLHDEGARRNECTWLGVARKSNQPVAWKERFGSGNPFDQILGISQVEIFNTTSWDLWTQDWKVKLVPVSKWSDWMDRLAQGQEQAANTEGYVNPTIVSETYNYLSSFDPNLVQQMVQH